MVDFGKINSNMKLGVYGGILVFISGFLPLIGGATGYWGFYFGYLDITHILYGIILAAIPFLPQFNIDIEDKILALAVLALGGIAALWGLASIATAYWWLGVLLMGLLCLIGGAMAAWGGWNEYQKIISKPARKTTSTKKSTSKKKSGPKY